MSCPVDWNVVSTYSLIARSVTRLVVLFCKNCPSLLIRVASAPTASTNFCALTCIAGAFKPMLAPSITVPFVIVPALISPSCILDSLTVTLSINKSPIVVFGSGLGLVIAPLPILPTDKFTFVEVNAVCVELPLKTDVPL